MRIYDFYTNTALPTEPRTPLPKIIVATRSFTQLCDHQAAFSGLRIAYCVNLRVGTIIIEVYAISALLFTELGTFYLSPNGIEC